MNTQSKILSAVIVVMMLSVTLAYVQPSDGSSDIVGAKELQDTVVLDVTKDYNDNREALLSLGIPEGKLSEYWVVNDKDVTFTMKDLNVTVHNDKAIIIGWDKGYTVYVNLEGNNVITCAPKTNDTFCWCLEVDGPDVEFTGTGSAVFKCESTSSAQKQSYGIVAVNSETQLRFSGSCSVYAYGADLRYRYSTAADTTVQSVGILSNNFIVHGTTDAKPTIVASGGNITPYITSQTGNLTLESCGISCTITSVIFDAYYCSMEVRGGNVGYFNCNGVAVTSRSIGLNMDSSGAVSDTDIKSVKLFATGGTAKGSSTVAETSALSAGIYYRMDNQDRALNFDRQDTTEKGCYVRSYSSDVDGPNNKSLGFYTSGKVRITNSYVMSTCGKMAAPFVSETKTCVAGFVGNSIIIASSVVIATSSLEYSGTYVQGSYGISAYGKNAVLQLFSEINLIAFGGDRATTFDLVDVKTENLVFCEGYDASGVFQTVTKENVSKFMTDGCREITFCSQYCVYYLDAKYDLADVIFVDSGQLSIVLKKYDGPVPSGMEFEGWNVDGKLCAPGSTYTDLDGMTLIYPVFKEVNDGSAILVIASAAAACIVAAGAAVFLLRKH